MYITQTNMILETEIANKYVTHIIVQ